MKSAKLKIKRLEIKKRELMSKKLSKYIYFLIILINL